jgi:hypothetical protein
LITAKIQIGILFVSLIEIRIHYSMNVFLGRIIVLLWIMIRIPNLGEKGIYFRLLVKKPRIVPYLKGTSDQL